MIICMLIHILIVHESADTSTCLMTAGRFLPQVSLLHSISPPVPYFSMGKVSTIANNVVSMKSASTFCYKYEDSFFGNGHFIGAKQACEARGTRLIVSNMPLLNTVTRLLFWIGAQEKTGERGAFEFLDGSPLSRNNPPCPTCPHWGAGEPNGDVSAASPALCVGYLRGFGLFDAPCDDLFSVGRDILSSHGLCVDDEEWRDVNGFDCRSYNDCCCSDGGYGPGWPSEWGTFANFSNADGVHAGMACCACNSGLGVSRATGARA